MLWIILKELFTVAFWPSKSGLLVSSRKKTFDQLLIMAGWIIVTFFLFNSIPHSIEVVLQYERGGLAQVKASMMALAIEFIPAFAFMIGLHNKTLEEGKRHILMWMSGPFILLTFHIQLSYYAGEKTITIWALELALILPYGAMVGTIAIAFLHTSFKTSANVLAEQIKEAAEAARAEAEIRITTLEESWRKVQAEKEELTDRLQKWQEWGTGAQSGNAVMQARIAELETQNASMQSEFVAERDALLAEFETQLQKKLRRQEEELRRSFEIQAVASGTALVTVGRGAADGGALDSGFFRATFQKTPAVAVLQEAFLAGVPESTLKSWVQRYTDWKWADVSSQVREGATAKG